MRLRARSHAPEIKRLTIQTAAESDYRRKERSLNQMSFVWTSLRVIQAATAGTTSQRMHSLRRLACHLGSLQEQDTQRINCVGRCVTISRRFNKTTITELTKMRGLLREYITLPIAFKAIRESRRAQLWSRQASIIMDLTALAFRQVAGKHHNQRH
jgi:hypothetical protein